MQTEKNTENLEKKHVRIRKLATELVDKNTIYQNDLIKSDKKIESMESKFNNLVEDFQKYINDKDKEIANKNEELRMSKERQGSINDDQFHPLNVDSEERNTAIHVYEQICGDFKMPQERDEVLLDTIEKFIYDKKQPNVAYGIWELSDFTHCNNVEKSYKLMKALMQDCYISIKKSESEITDDEKHSFSFRETQLKESFEKEKKMIDQKFEQMKHDLEQRSHEIYELKDIIRLKNQEYELLKQKFRDYEVEVLSGDNQESGNKHRRPDSNYKSDYGSGRQSRSHSDNRSADNPIQPYQIHKKENDDLKVILYQLQDENNEFRQKLGLRPDYSMRKSYNDDIEHKRTNENDGTVVIGGMSHMGLNATNENTSIGNYNIEMSPIEVNDKDVSRADEAILGVFGHSADRDKKGKRKLNFDDNENTNKENIRTSSPELDDIRSNKDILYRNKENLVDNLRKQLEDKQSKIEEMANKLDYYAANSKDYSSPRFMQPEHIRNEKTKTQRLTADNIFKEVIKIFENSERVYEIYIEKFEQQIDNE
jgi:hypothetical protein